MSTLAVMGSLDSGLIIQADRPSHLQGGRQTMVLTPDDARELIKKLLLQVRTIRESNDCVVLVGDRERPQ
jgi:hypothetical protein